MPPPFHWRPSSRLATLPQPSQHPQAWHPQPNPALLTIVYPSCPLSVGQKIGLTSPHLIRLIRSIRGYWLTPPSVAQRLRPCLRHRQTQAKYTKTAYPQFPLAPVRSSPRVHKRHPREPRMSHPQPSPPPALCHRLLPRFVCCGDSQCKIFPVCFANTPRSVAHAQPLQTNVRI